MRGKTPRVVAQRMFTTTLARTRNQSFWQGAFTVVHSCCRKFLKHVHNLFTRPLWLPSPAGLRLEISCESDKKKMNFIFDYDKKIFLTGKMKHACRRENKKQCVEKISRANRDGIRKRRNEQTSLLIGCASRVDRIRLCTQFLASASGS